MGRASLTDALAHASGSTTILILSSDGVDVTSAMQSLSTRWQGLAEAACTSEKATEEPTAVHQVIILLGDDRGLTESEVEAAEELAAQHENCEVVHLSLGPEVLLGSHCIVLLNHYMDRFLHCCPGKL